MGLTNQDNLEVITMNNMVKLLNFEFERLSKLLLGLMIFNLVMQSASVMWTVYNYFSYSKEAQPDIPLSFSEAMNSERIVIVVLLTIFILMGYAFYTWYREWFGKSQFSYRLLMLPGNRMQIYFAKLMSLFIGVLLLVALQIVLIIVGNGLFEMMIPADSIRTINVFKNNEAFHSSVINIIFSWNWSEFVIQYMIGFMVLNIIFTGILIERCFGMRGFVGAICLYGISFFGGIGVWNYIYTNTYRWNLFAYESIYILCGLMMVYTIVCMSGSYYLINRRIRV